MAISLQRIMIKQVYTQLTFDCPANKSLVEFKQELKDNRNTLLDDIERVDCRSVQKYTCDDVLFVFRAGN